ncbi:DNA polymerase III subunit delta [candidate division KSB1 bacterium]|nr:DNA polymerase III subunit delta [candidate division KSB1 bacterium]
MNKASDKYTSNQFYADLHDGRIALFYLFYGEEEFLIRRATDALQKAALQPGDEDFNLDVLYGSETDGATIINAAMSFPMMASRRLVIVKDFHHLDEKGHALLLKYAEKPSPSSCLCLTSSKYTGASGIIKKLAPYARVLEAKRLYDNQVPAWIRSHLKERGYTIAEEAATLLQMNVGNSLRRLSSEIDKIELLKKESRDITIEDVEAVVGATKEYNVFEFCDAVAGKDVEKSLRILYRLIELGESPVGLLVMLNRHFAILAKTKELALKRTAKEEMAKNLRVNHYFLDKYLQQAQKYRREQIQQIFQLMLTADAQLKMSYQKPRLTLETLLFEIFSSI